MGNAELARKLDVLKRHCDETGRDYAEIEKTTLGQVRLGPGGTSTDEMIGMCRKLAEIGMDTLIFSMDNVHEITPIETIAREVMPTVAEL